MCIYLYFLLGQTMQTFNDGVLCPQLVIMYNNFGQMVCYINFIKVRKMNVLLFINCSSQEYLTIVICVISVDNIHD